MNSPARSTRPRAGRGGGPAPGGAASDPSGRPRRRAPAPTAAPACRARSRSGLGLQIRPYGRVMFVFCYISCVLYIVMICSRPHGQSACQESANREALTLNLWEVTSGPRNTLLYTKIALESNPLKSIAHGQVADGRACFRGGAARSRQVTALRRRFWEESAQTNRLQTSLASDGQGGGSRPARGRLSGRLRVGLTGTQPPALPLPRNLRSWRRRSFLAADTWGQH